VHDWQTIAAVVIFAVAYVLIASEKIHKTVVALGGAALMLLLGIVEQHEAFHGEEGEAGMGVEWNTVFLLIGMMLLVSIMRETGVFQWLAIKSAKAAKGEPIRIILLLSAVTAVLSALLDNVTTVLLIAPVTILIAESLEVDPVPFLVCEILASNIGGTSTLVGDPPNIMIAGQTGFSFMEFLIRLGPPIVAVFAAYAATVWIMLRKRVTVSAEKREMVMAFDESRSITDRPLLVKSLIVLGVTLCGFVVHGAIGLEPATIAISGATLLLLVSGKHPLKHLEEVEWPTIFFFVGLFIMVSGLVKKGIISILASKLFAVTGGSRILLAMVILWLSAVVSGIVDNIPYTATAIPVTFDVSRELVDPGGALTLRELAHHPFIQPLWWALALGACLGGNFTVIGASANVVVAGISEKSGHPITFGRFLKYGIPLTIQHLIISTAYVWLLLKLSAGG
jgi:Na+/H+ antiporter NhaD/arsenite permease-like protein